MANVVIYYQQEENKTIEETIDHINNLIKTAELHHNIKRVFIDNLDSRNEFYELLNSNLENIDIILLEGRLTDEFDKKMLLGVARTGNIRIGSMTQEL